jgi:hypothetical protein
MTINARGDSLWVNLAPSRVRPMGAATAHVYPRDNDVS